MGGKQLISFDRISQLAPNDIRYAGRDLSLRPFYAHEPTLAGMEAAVAARQGRVYPRSDLVRVLREQYLGLGDMERVSAGIEALGRTDTWCMTTAHQPALFLGPHYFLYKAVSTIRAAGRASAHLGKPVVPVFVLGSEDHDLEELNHIHLFGRRLVWEPGESGAIGCMSTRGVLPLLDALRELGGRAPYLEPSMDMMEACYREAPDMASATRRLLHHLFGAHGLVVLDPNHSDLKRHFIEVMCDELEGQTTQRLVGATIERLREVGWKPQAVPRPVNLFYLDSGRRSRIVRESGGFRVEGTAGWWSLKDLQELVVEQPERFSPNVLLRPLYQEMLLPNLAYVGGGGELAYWLERKAQFEHFGVPFPVLLRRNSVLYVEGASLRKLQRLGISVGDIFTDTEGLIRHYVAAHQQAEVTLEAEMLTLSQLYGALAVKAAAVDASLEQAVHADAARALAGLEHWQGRLWKAEKQRHETALNQIRNLKDRLFPGGGLQERSENFLARYWQDGGGWIDTLLENLDPLEAGFVVLEL